MPGQPGSPPCQVLWGADFRRRGRPEAGGRLLLCDGQPGESAEAAGGPGTEGKGLGPLSRLCPVQEGQDCCLDGRFYGNVGRFLNHSCQPNLAAVRVVVGPGPSGIAFFSTRPIRAGEELG